MVAHRCKDCLRVFTAESREEAEEAYNAQAKQSKTTAASFKDAVDTGEVAYARFCPYCGSTLIELS